MDKLKFIELYDIYKELLTPTQREIGGMYLNLDLSLSEIALEKGISRAGVSECLKTCKKAFLDFEEKLQLLKSKTLQKTKDELIKEDLKSLVDSLDETSRGKLEQILGTDYAKKALEIINKQV